MKRYITAVFCILLASLITLCGCSTGVKQLTPSTAPDATQPLSDGDHTPVLAFAKNLFERIAPDETNPVISPASVYTCLAMVQAGARGKTLEEFTRVMQADAQPSGAICAALASGLSATAGSTQLALANSLWADDDRAVISDSYIAGLSNGYGAQAFTADLPSDEALKAINAWVNEKTNGLIPTLHEQNYDDSTILVLLNTLYFKGKWQQPFESVFTNDMPFNKADGTSVTAPFMSAPLSKQAYISTENAEGILLPYDDGKTAFLALRATDNKSARELAASLSGASFKAYADTAQSRLMNLSMPKFTVEFSVYLNDALEAMGLTTLFDADTCDLSGIGTGTNGKLYVSQVFHKLKLVVDEVGTEAAAVTEVTMDEGAAVFDEDPIELCLDSPFVYAMIDLESGVPLFMGILDCPA